VSILLDLAQLLMDVELHWAHKDGPSEIFIRWLANSRREKKARILTLFWRNIKETSPLTWGLGGRQARTCSLQDPCTHPLMAYSKGQSATLLSTRLISSRQERAFRSVLINYTLEIQINILMLLFSNSMLNCVRN